MCIYYKYLQIKIANVSRLFFFNTDIQDVIAK